MVSNPFSTVDALSAHLLENPSEAGSFTSDVWTLIHTPLIHWKFLLKQEGAETRLRELSNAAAQSGLLELCVRLLDRVIEQGKLSKPDVVQTLEVVDQFWLEYLGQARRIRMADGIQSETMGLDSASLRRFALMLEEADEDLPENIWEWRRSLCLGRVEIVASVAEASLTIYEREGLHDRLSELKELLHGPEMGSILSFAWDLLSHRIELDSKKTEKIFMDTRDLLNRQHEIDRRPV